jgi:hypothetical protein
LLRREWRPLAVNGQSLHSPRRDKTVAIEDEPLLQNRIYESAP